MTKSLDNNHFFKGFGRFFLFPDTFEKLQWLETGKTPKSLENNDFFHGIWSFFLFWIQKVSENRKMTKSFEFSKTVTYRGHRTTLNMAGGVIEYGKCLETEKQQNPLNSAKTSLTGGTERPFRCLEDLLHKGAVWHWLIDRFSCFKPNTFTLFSLHGIFGFLTKFSLDINLHVLHTTDGITIWGKEVFTNQKHQRPENRKKSKWEL